MLRGVDDSSARFPMQPSRRQPRRLLLLLGAVALLAAVLPATLQAATARPVRLEAGVQRGYTFSAAGAILSSKVATLAGPVTVQSSDRVWITGRGAHFRI